MIRKSPSHDRHRRGLTLVELLAALSLTAILAAGWAGSLRGLTAQRKLTTSKLGDRPVQRRFFQQLEREITQAFHLQAAPNRFVISGYGGTDPVTGRARHRPMEIEYAVESDRDASRLVRRERLLGQLNNDRGPPETVLEDIAQLQTVALEESSIKASTTTWQGPLPSRIRISLQGKSGDNVSCEETFYVR